MVINQVEIILLHIIFLIYIPYATRYFIHNSSLIMPIMDAYISCLKDKGDDSTAADCVQRSFFIEEIKKKTTRFWLRSWKKLVARPDTCGGVFSKVDHYYCSAKLPHE